MIIFKAMERMGLKGTLAFGVTLFGANFYVFTNASSNISEREKRKSDEIRQSLRPTKPREATYAWSKRYADEIKELRRERGIRD